MVPLSCGLAATEGKAAVRALGLTALAVTKTVRYGLIVGSLWHNNGVRQSSVYVLAFAGVFF